MSLRKHCGSLSKTTRYFASPRVFFFLMKLDIDRLKKIHVEGREEAKFEQLHSTSRLGEKYVESES